LIKKHDKSSSENNKKEVKSIHIIYILFYDTNGSLNIKLDHVHSISFQSTISSNINQQNLQNSSSLFSDQPSSKDPKNSVDPLGFNCKGDFCDFDYENVVSNKKFDQNIFDEEKDEKEENEENSSSTIINQPSTKTTNPSSTSYFLIPYKQISLTKKEMKNDLKLLQNKDDYSILPTSTSNSSNSNYSSNSVNNHQQDQQKDQKQELEELGPLSFWFDELKIWYHTFGRNQIFKNSSNSSSSTTTRAMEDQEKMEEEIMFRSSLSTSTNNHSHSHNLDQYYKNAKVCYNCYYTYLQLKTLRCNFQQNYFNLKQQSLKSDMDNENSKVFFSFFYFVLFSRI